MGNYKVSEATKSNLIEAAGELFAEHSAEAVSVREITRRAGTMPNAVSYHFGGKEGLVKAVWEYVLERWDVSRMRGYYDRNKQLAATKDGQKQLVSDLINILYEMIYAEGQPVWINVFILRSALTGKGKKYIERAIYSQVMPVLVDVFRTVTGNKDWDTARCWALQIFGAAAVFTVNLTQFTEFNPAETSNYAFYRRLQYSVTQNALHGAGLV